MNTFFGVGLGIIFFILGFFLFPGIPSFIAYFIGAFFFVITFKKRNF